MSGGGRLDSRFGPGAPVLPVELALEEPGRKVQDEWTSVRAACRHRRSRQVVEQSAHRRRLEWTPTAHRRAARERHEQPLAPALVVTRGLFEQLLQVQCHVLSVRQGRDGADEEIASAEPIDVEADPLEVRESFLEQRCLVRLERQHDWLEQRLHLRRTVAESGEESVINDSLVRAVLVDEEEALAPLSEDEGLAELCDDAQLAEWFVRIGRIVPARARRFHQASARCG